MSTTTKIPAGNQEWTVTAPDGVTVTPPPDANTPIGIAIDYGAAALLGGAHGILDIVFEEPASVELRQKVEITVKNSLGLPIDGFTIYTANDTPPTPPDTQRAHPSNYSHFHDMAATTFSGVGSTVYLQDLVTPAAFGPPGSLSPGAIVARGTVADGATVVGIPITLHQAANAGVDDDFHLDIFPHLSSGQQVLALTAESESRAEGNSGSTAFTFTVVRSGDAAAVGSTTVSVDYAVTGDGANPAGPADFAGGSLPQGTVTFGPGETRKDITIDVAGDTAVERGEGFALTLSNATGGAVVARLGDAAGTIGNDDSGPLPSTADIVGTNGNDILTGTSGADVLRGLEGDDTLTGREGDDSLFGDADDDLLKGSGGNDLIDGGDDSDAVDYGDGSSAVTVDLRAGTAADGGGGTDSLRDIERVIGSRFGDQLNGDEFANTLLGNAGDDTLFGDGGDDLLKGSEGNDVVDGGDGSDSVDYGDGAAALTVDLGAGTAGDGGGGTDTLRNIERVIGSRFGDQLVGDGFDNVLLGNDGNDRFFADAGNDRLDGGKGRDSVRFTEGAGGGVQVDLAAGTASDGQGGNDRLVGINDVAGTFFDDVISGGAGANLIHGEAGNDTLTGADGGDSFLWDDSSDFGGDRVTDFRSGSDRLLFDGGDALHSQVPISGAVGPDNLVIGTVPQDGDDYFLFDPASHQLSVDLDGNGPGGGAVVATLDGVTTLSAGDIWVV